MTPLRFAPLLLVSCLGACAGPLNNEPGIGNAGRTFGNSIYTPVTLTEGLPPAPAEGMEPTIDQQAAPVYHASGPVPAAIAQPSLVTLDRDNWDAMRVDVPDDFVAHQPRLARDYLIKSTDPRAQGKYPDERTAMGTSTTRHNNEQFVEALVSPFVAAQNVVMMVPRAIVEKRPKSPTRTGGEGYERAPRNVTIVNPTADTVPGLVQGDPTAAPGGPIQSPLKRPAAGTGKPPIPPNGSPRIIQSPPVIPPHTENPVQPPAEDLRPGGGMPATDVPSHAP